MRKRIVAGSLWSVSVLCGCTPFEGDTTGTTTGAGAGGSTSQSSGSPTSSSSGSGSKSSSGAGGMGPLLETITVLDLANAPQPGLTVFSAKPDGTIDSTKTTDAQGQVTLDLPAGGSVSLADLDALRVITYFEVPDGSSIRFYRGPVRKNPNAAKPVQIVNPTSTATVIEYGQSCDFFVYGVAGNGTVFNNYPVAGCPNQANYDVVAVGLGPQVVGAVLSAGTKLGIAYSNGTIGTIPQAATTVGSAKGVAMIPPTAASSAFKVTGRRSGVPFYHRELLAANGGPVEMPTSIFNSFDFEQKVSFAPSGNSTRVLRHLEHKATLPTGTMITMPPSPLDPVVVAEAPNLATGTLPFALSGAAYADAVVLEIDQAATWTVLTPATASGTVTLPTLPAGFESLKPSGSGFVFTTRHVDDAQATSYAALLAAGWQLEDETLDESRIIRTY